jgi:Domain of unknown function (DUF4394)
MRYKKKNRFFTILTIAAPVFAVSLTFSLMIKHSASAKSNLNPSSAAVSSAAGSGAQYVLLPRTNIYSITNDNTLFVLTPGSTGFNRLNTIRNVDGTVIGIDFRVSDGQLYALSDTNKLYTINLSNASATLVNNLTTPFAGGILSLLDFNPVLNAIRLIGSNDQNYAIVSNGGDLNLTVAQTKVAYAAGDVNAGIDPNIAGGSYTNNFVGATTTIFYAIDYDTDNIVTIANKANGSSATGGGQLQTIGKFFDVRNLNGGTPVNFSPTADMDIYTDQRTGIDTAIVLSSNTLYTLILDQIRRDLPLGSTQKLGAFGVRLSSSSNSTGYIDVAVQPRAGSTATP